MPTKVDSSKFDELIGKKFGKWTIKKITGVDKFNKPLCLCECDCGNLVEAQHHSVARKKRLICRRCRRKEKAEKMIGTVFGDLVLVEPVFHRKFSIKWICKCKCGKFTKTSEFRLNSGRSKQCHSCGLRAFRNKEETLVGKTCGRWTIIRFSHSGKRRSRFWECRCECERVSTLTSGQLNIAAKYNSGCRDCKKERQKKTAFEGIYNRIRAGARHRGIPFAVTREEIFSLLDQQNWKCNLTGLSITIAKGRDAFMHGKGSASLDRIDSDLGYINGNLQWVHKTVNLMKRDLKQSDFIELCNLVTKKHESK